MILYVHFIRYTFDFIRCRVGLRFKDRGCGSVCHLMWIWQPTRREVKVETNILPLNYLD